MKDPAQLLPDIGQIAITVNGRCCARSQSSAPNFPFRQLLLDLTGGPAAELPDTEQRPSVAELFSRAHDWLRSMETALAEERPRGE